MFIPKITIIQKFVDIIFIQIGRKKSAAIFFLHFRSAPLFCNASRMRKSNSTLIL